jgi:hypothetical protein
MNLWPTGALVAGWLALYGVAIAAAVVSFYERKSNPGGLALKVLPFLVGIIPSVFTIHVTVKDPLEIFQGAAFMLVVTSGLIYVTLKQWKQ